MAVLDVVGGAFQNSVDLLLHEIPPMPLNRWNESVFRYQFCRFVAMDHPEVSQFVECDRIDLVLERLSQRAFVEFKFYVRRPRIEPYTGSVGGWKGGPSPTNLREFESCIETLWRRPSKPGLAKYVVLVYADPANGTRHSRRFADVYDDYEHPCLDSDVELVRSRGPVEAGQELVGARLYRLAGGPQYSNCQDSNCQD